MTPSTNRLPFQRKNYLLMIIGICVIILGFIAMFLDREPYGFGFLGITLGPRHCPWIWYSIFCHSLGKKR